MSIAIITDNISKWRATRLMRFRVSSIRNLLRNHVSMTGAQIESSAVNYRVPNNVRSIIYLTAFFFRYIKGLLFFHFLRGSMKQLSSRLFIILLSAVTLFLLTAWPATSSKVMGNSTRLRQQDGVGKQKRKVIDQGVAYPNQPIEIVELKVNGRAAQLSQGIDGDTDWLNGLSWKIKNLSKKNILSIDLFVTFPDTQSTGRLLVYPMHYGTDPKIAKNPEIVKPVKSEDTADFVISSEVYGDIKPHLEARIPLSDVNHVRIKLELIVFDDDTAWGSGQEMRRDQNDPRRWIPIE